MYKKPLLSFCIITAIASNLFAGSHHSHHDSTPKIYDPEMPYQTNSYTNVNNLPMPPFPHPPILSTNLSQPSGYLQFYYSGTTFPVAYYEQNGNKFFYNLKNGMLLSITGSVDNYGVAFKTTWNFNPRVGSNQTSAHLATVVQISSQPLVIPNSNMNKVPLTLIWSHNTGRDENENSNGFSFTTSPADATFSTQTWGAFNPSSGVLTKNINVTKSPKSVSNKMVEGIFIASPISQLNLSKLQSGYNQSFPGTFLIPLQENNNVLSNESETNSSIDEAAP